MTSTRSVWCRAGGRCSSIPPGPRRPTTPARPSSWTRATSSVRIPGRSREDAVPKVEDMPRAVPACARTARASVAPRRRVRGTPRGRDCLHGEAADAPAGLVEGDTPVDADHVGTRVAMRRAARRSRPRRRWSPRRGRPRRRALGGGGQHRRGVLGGRERPAQLSKSWMHWRPPRSGRATRRSPCRPVDPSAARRAPVGVEHSLHLGEIARRAALDEVAGDGEGAPAKPIRATPGELAATRATAAAT